MAASIIALAGLSACSSNDDNVFDTAQMQAGTCIRTPPDMPAEVGRLPVVPCDEEHTHEISGTSQYIDTNLDSTATTSDVFPGLEALNAFAEAACLDKFQSYVGLSVFEAEDLTYSWLTPTLESWTDKQQRDRTVICVVTSFGGAPMFGSVAGLGVEADSVVSTTTTG